MKTIEQRVRTGLGVAVAALALAGCSGGSDEPRAERPAEAPANPAALPAGLFLAAAPEGEQPVSKLKTATDVGDAVVMRVVVGGRAKPFVPGRAIFTVVDHATTNPCTRDDDHCRTPWDYCCTPAEQLTPDLATVQLADANGKVLLVDLEAAGKIKPLDTIVVSGVVAAKPDARTMVVNATGIHVVPN